MRGASLVMLMASIAAVLLLSLSPLAGAEDKGLPEGGCDELLVMVDGEHGLSPIYAPPDLVYLGDYGVSVLGWSVMLREEAAEHLAELVSAASLEGRELVVASAYRSFYDQALAHAFYTSIYGSEAGRVSAPPGNSEHQLGTTVDFTNAAAGYEIQQGFGETEAARWLREHAAEYGFVLSYPRGEEEETGYVWEPWHYRYVGVDNARVIQEEKLDAHAFLAQEGVRPNCG